MVALFALTPSTSVESKMFDQYQVKAVFFLNLAKFTSWPKHIEDTPSDYFIIGILGHNRFEDYLEQAAGNESIKGRPVRINRYASLAEIQKEPCRVLFIASDQLPIWPQIREIALRYQILTVGDVDGFCHRGGIVNLRVSAHKILIEINVQEAIGSGFCVSSKLLKLGRIIDGVKEE
jgi:hypothetical protein